MAPEGMVVTSMLTPVLVRVGAQAPMATPLFPVVAAQADSAGQRFQRKLAARVALYLRAHEHLLGQRGELATVTY